MLNKVQLIGNLGKDPESREAGGSTVCKFSVATSERFKDRSGEMQTKTEWHNITVWGKLAEICQQYLHKGSKVYIEGKIQTRSYDKDGEKRYATEIIANEMKMLDPKGSSGASSSGGTANPAPHWEDDESIPF